MKSCATILIKIFLALTVSGLVLASPAFAAGTPQPKNKILLFVADRSTGFWPMVTTYARAAAEDLQIDLNVISVDDPRDLITKAEDNLKNPDKRPAGLLFFNYKERAPRILELAESYKVPTLIYNVGPSEAMNAEIGQPRTKFKTYLGVISPDDYKAGRDLIDTLLGIAEKKKLRASDGKFHLVAIDGHLFTPEAQDRKNGMEEILRHRSDVVLEQRFQGFYEQERARLAFRAAVKRYPEAKIFWTASDSMALGVLDGAAETGKVPGKDFIVGGIDLLPGIQSRIEKGEIAASAGGHFTEIVWALALMNDYLNGCDFNDAPDYRIKSSMLIMSEGDKSRIPCNDSSCVENWITDKDFSRYSRCLNNPSFPFSYAARDLY